MDALFSQIEDWHGDEPWGDVLDAGTGQHSLSWLMSLNTASVTALTGAPNTHKQLNLTFNKQLRNQDELILGNWMNQSLLHGKSYDVILADYLLGSIDGFAPYFQKDLFTRLKKHARNKVYVVGQAPILSAETTEAKHIERLFSLRDACIKLAGHRCYREYPLKWCQEQLDCSGFEVLKSTTVAVKFNLRSALNQLQVCSSKIPYMSSPELRKAMSLEIERIRKDFRMLFERTPFITGLSDYIICSKVRTP